VGSKALPERYQSARGYVMLPQMAKLFGAIEISMQ